MQALAIVVADAARARLFTFKREDDQAAGPVLRERADLVNPEGRLHDREVYSESRPSLASKTGTLDDHRDAHASENERRFAQQVIERAATLVKDTACARIALVASPRFLGHLRDQAGALRGLPVDELARDLTHEATPKLREHLATLGVLPAGR
jgi:protein required for attachment to host cells